MAIETAILEILIPSWWEVEVTVATSVFVTLAYWFFAHGTRGNGGFDPDRSLVENPAGPGDDNGKMAHLKGDSQSNSAYVIKVELLAAKNLIGANLNGTSDPYAIITCGTEKRFRIVDPSRWWSFVGAN